MAAYTPEWVHQLAEERGYLHYNYPLIKPVWAVHGDHVFYANQSVSVSKRPDIAVELQDVLGRDTPQKSGYIVQKLGEYLLISPDVQTGFGSQYFGPVRADNFLGVVQYLENSKNLKSSENLDLVGF